MSTLTDDQKRAKTDADKNALISASCGIKPTLEDWVCMSPTEDSIVMSGQKHECEKWLARLPDSSKYRNYEVRPFYRFLPFTTSYDAAAQMRAALTEDEQYPFTFNLTEIVKPTGPTEPSVLVWLILNATPAQQCEAFGRVRNLWP